MQDAQGSFLEPHQAQRPRRRAVRRALDHYDTPQFALDVLADRVPAAGDRLLAPTCGDGRCAAAVADRFETVICNDVRPVQLVKFPDHVTVQRLQLDATKPELWDAPVDWVVDNVPFKYADRITPHALKCARRGVALLLRLTFLEATEGRQWLQSTPPQRLIVLPRLSFTNRGHDQVVPMWCVWGADIKPGIEILGKSSTRQMVLL